MVRSYEEAMIAREEQIMNTSRWFRIGGKFDSPRIMQKVVWAMICKQEKLMAIRHNRAQKLLQDIALFALAKVQLMRW